MFVDISPRYIRSVKHDQRKQVLPVFEPDIVAARFLHLSECFKIDDNLNDQCNDRNACIVHADLPSMCRTFFGNRFYASAFEILLNDDLSIPAADADLDLIRELGNDGFFQFIPFFFACFGIILNIAAVVCQRPVVIDSSR